MSACCVVEGMEHELLVLPKRTGETNPDGSDVRYGMQVRGHCSDDGSAEGSGNSWWC